MSSIRVSLVTVGCARNDVDSEEVGGRLAADGFELVDDQGDADIVVVNTCGFVEAARKDSVDALLESVEPGRHVVAIGCMAERYGTELADAMPEVDAVLGFDSYPDIAARLREILDGHAPAPHAPRDRRMLLPITPAQRPAASADVVLPGHGWVPRHRLDDGPVAPLKLASGCDRRCAFCAIPSFRGSFVSRPPEEVLAEARWLAENGAREIVLVSENSTSYGKDLGDLRLLESLLPQLAAVDGVERIRVSYLQPAEMRPGLIDVIATTPGVAAYADLSFQHASPTVLRRMRRFGGTDEFLGLIAALRERAPRIGIRSNVIVGFPGETDADVEELERFLSEARLDAMGVFGYSAEEGTEAASYDGALPDDEIRRRAARLSDLVDDLTLQRAEERIGERVRVIVTGEEDGEVIGAAEHQGPDDAVTRLEGRGLAVGDVVDATVVGIDGVDLVAAT